MESCHNIDKVFKTFSEHGHDKCPLHIVWNCILVQSTNMKTLLPNMGEKNTDPNRKNRAMYKNAEKFLANTLPEFDSFLLLEEKFDLL